MKSKKVLIIIFSMLALIFSSSICKSLSDFTSFGFEDEKLQKAENEIDQENEQEGSLELSLNFNHSYQITHQKITLKPSFKHEKKPSSISLVPTSPPNC